MGHPNSEITFGVPERSGDDRLWTAYPQGDAPNSAGSAQGLAATATVSAASATAQGGGAGFLEPSNYPLALIYPRQAGTAPSQHSGAPAMPSGHRIFKQHPSFAYQISPMVKGGALPYTYSLSNAPSGMTINSLTGEINWPSPSGTVTPTLNVTDAAGVTRSEPWTIDVTTSGWIFVDAVNGNDTTGTGLIGAPWRTLQKAYESATSSSIIVFRAGTYGPAGIPRIANIIIEFSAASNRSVQWIAWPGEAVTYNGAYAAGVDPGARIRWIGSATRPVYVDGVRIGNVGNMVTQFQSGNSDYPVLRNVEIFDLFEGVGGDNPGGLMTIASYTDPTWYMHIIGMRAHDLDAGGLKLYSQKHHLVERSVFEDCREGPDRKSHVPAYEWRNNIFRNNGLGGIWQGYHGNMNMGADGNGERAYGEDRFNLVLASGGLAIDLNQDGMCDTCYEVRNTLVGSVVVRKLDNAESGAPYDDGPFNFRRCVVINPNSAQPSRINFWRDPSGGNQTTQPSNVVLVDNLSGGTSDGIVSTSTGELQGQYATDHGPSSGAPRGCVLAWLPN